MSQTLQHILVVEDEDDSVQVVSKILKYHGIEVVITRNGRECIEMLQHIEPSVVVMDLAMPEMDGWETLVAMRSNPSTAHIPVVAVTAYHSAKVAFDAIGAGFNAYFPKPLDPEHFVKDLDQVLNQ